MYLIAVPLTVSGMLKLVPVFAAGYCINQPSELYKTPFAVRYFVFALLTVKLIRVSISENAVSDISVTLAPMLIYLNVVPLNASEPMLVTLDGNVR